MYIYICKYIYICIRIYIYICVYIYICCVILIIHELGVRFLTNKYFREQHRGCSLPGVSPDIADNVVGVYNHVAKYMDTYGGFLK